MSSTSLPSTSAPDPTRHVAETTAESIAETIHVRAVTHGSAVSQQSSQRLRDWLGSVVQTCYLCTDVLLADQLHADAVSKLWFEAGLDTESKTRRRLAAFGDAATLIADAPCGLPETAALALEGLRCTYLGLESALLEPGFRPPLGVPFVACVAGLGQSKRPSFEHFEFAARTPQEATDFCVIAHALSELSLCPGVVRIDQDPNEFSFAPVDLLASELMYSIVGSASDEVDTPTDRQRNIFGASRRRIPSPMAHAADPAALMKDVRELTKVVLERFSALTGRSYERTDREISGTSNRADTPGLLVHLVSDRAVDIARRVASGCSDVCAISGDIRVRTEGDRVSLSVGSNANATIDRSDPADVLIVAGASRSALERSTGALTEGGAIMVDGLGENPEQIWQSFSDTTRQRVSEREQRVFAFDAGETESDAARRRSFEAAAVGLISRTYTDGSRKNGDGLPLQMAGPTTYDLVELSWVEYDVAPDFFREDRKPHLAALASASEASDAVLQRLLAYHHNGADLGRSLADSGLIPLSVFPYLNAPGIRGPYPFVLGDELEVPAVSLTNLIDDLIAGEGVADTRDERVRQLLKLDSGVRKSLVDHPARKLSELWSELSAGLELVPPHEHQGDDTLFGFSEASLLSLLAHACGRRWREHLAASRKEFGDLAIQVDELLRGDFNDSTEGRAPDHLEASVGKAFAAELDFDALSGIIAETSHGDRLSERRRRRLKSVAAVLVRVPAALEAASRESVHFGEAGLTEAVAGVRRDRRSIVALARAVRVARLELAGKYREEKHDSLLARFSFGDADPEEAALCPPRVVALQGNCSGLVDMLASDMPITVMLSVHQIPTTMPRSHFGGTCESKAAGFALQVVSLATAYVFQSPASELGAIARAASRAARLQGPSLFSLFYGSDTVVRALDAYLASAIALESRAFPAFEFDPSGRTWADRFSIQENPTAASPWGWADIEIATTAGEEVRPAPFTFADFLACDTMYVDEFCVVPPEMWHPAMMPLDEYLASADVGNDSGAQVPFLWMADESGMLHRTVVTTRVVEAARNLMTRWNTLQELGGVRSSHAERLVTEAVKRLETEKRDAIDEVARNYEAELERTTGAVAQEIVSNIAAGLLGLQSSSSRPPFSSDQSFAIPAAAPESREVEETVELPETAVSDVDDNADDSSDDEVITLDDPYIETVRCTTCNECTNINDRLFAYNENQQAYIKDATAGSYHELVVAAEMCPVKIIHPGKPLNPDEPRLAELIERAKPYH